MCVLSELRKNCPKNGIEKMFVIELVKGAAEMMNLEEEYLSN